MRDQTLAVHAGAAPDPETGAVAPPLHLSTTFAHGPAGERRAGFEYQREDNPTQARLESALAAMEHGRAALAFASGMAAMSALLEGLPADSQLLIPDDCYTGLRVLATDFLATRSIAVQAVDMADIDVVRAALTPRTRMIWCETPSNPRLKIEIGRGIGVHQRSGHVGLSSRQTPRIVIRGAAQGVSVECRFRPVVSGLQAPA